MAHLHLLSVVVGFFVIGINVTLILLYQIQKDENHSIYAPLIFLLLVLAVSYGVGSIFVGLYLMM